MPCVRLTQISEPMSPRVFTPDLRPQQNSTASVNQDQDGARGGVCIVDDDDWVSDSLRVLLETYGFSVTSCRSGTEFLADRLAGHTGCLVIDQHMPGLEGLDVVAELRRRGNAIPTILITGRLDPGIAQRAARLRVIGILEKPFAVGSLIELIRRAVGRPV